MTTFHRAQIGSTTVASGYTAGSGSLVVADGTQFGTTFPIVVIAVRAGARLSVLNVTARSTNTLTVSGAVDGTTDVNLIIGDTIREGPCALHVNELQDAVNANDAAAVHIAGAETITGSKTFSSAIVMSNNADITMASGVDTAHMIADGGVGPGIEVITTNSGHGAYFTMTGGYEAWLNFTNSSNSSGNQQCRYGMGHISDSFQLDAFKPGLVEGIFKIHLNCPAGTFVLGWSGSAPTLGVFGATPAAKQTVTGSKGGNAALASLLTAMANYGLITDSSS
jgi:hypothetical protein